MLNSSKLTIRTAIANQSEAMEAETILKNEWSLKSLMSRGNFLKLIVFFVAICASTEVWGQTFKYTGKFISSMVFMDMPTLGDGNFSITIDLKEASYKSGDYGDFTGSVDNIKISASFSSKTPYSHTDNFNFQARIITSDGRLADNALIDEEGYILKIGSKGMTFKVSKENQKEGVFQYLMDKTDIIGFDLNALVKAIESKTSSNTTTTPSTQSNGSASSNGYKIGDTGPAGGIVFYDKGFYSDDWRYLEAAPKSTEFMADWGTSGISGNDNSSVIGSGKENTVAITAYSIHEGEQYSAAYRCYYEINVNGYKDWFLPSKDELNLMYQNLAKQGLGGFDDGRVYWSSSVKPRPNSSMTYLQFFSNGNQASIKPSNSGTGLRVRAIRAF